MRRRSLVPLVLGAIALVIVTAWGAGQAMDKRQLETYLENQYFRAFFDLVGLVENINVQLGKGLVASSPNQTMLTLTDAWRQAYIAQASLTQLPLTQAPIPETAKFLTQLGDFAFVTARDAAMGVTMDADRRRLLQSFYEESAYLANELHSLVKDVSDGQFRWSRVRETSRDVAADKFKRIEQQMSELPTLIYDGPFSDHIEQAEPKGLTGEEINVERAKAIALDFVEIPRGVQYDVEKFAEPDGKIPAYTMRVFPRQGNSDNVYFLDISKKGGHVIWMVNVRSVPNSALSREEAMEKAEEFLSSRGYPNMVPMYTWEHQNIITVISVLIQDDVIIYPDQIKVEVAADNGQILGVESLTYIMSHHKRDLPEPEISEEEARNLANAEMEIEAVRLALIPLPTLEERLCWEVKGRLNGEVYLVYINAITGDEEMILQIIDMPNGQLTL